MENVILATHILYSTQIYWLHHGMHYIHSQSNTAVYIGTRHTTYIIRAIYCTTTTQTINRPKFSYSTLKFLPVTEPVHSRYITSANPLDMKFSGITGFNAVTVYYIV